MTLAQLRADFREGRIGKPDYIDGMHRLHRALFDYAEFIRETDIGSIEITDGSVVMTTRAGLRFVVDRDDKRVTPVETLNFGRYEGEDFDMVLRLVEDGATVLDIGGNVGWYSMNIAKARPKATVLTFEPIPRTYAYLLRNLEMNRIGNVRPHNFGFSDGERDIAFYYDPEGSGNSSMAHLSGGGRVAEVVARVRRLDDFMAETGRKADFLKVDVEGAELLVFRGGVEAIRRDRPVIFSELLRKWTASFGYHPNEVLSLLKEIGYRCFTAGGGRLQEIAAMDEGTVETNFFFLHSEAHRDRIERCSKAG